MKWKAKGIKLETANKSVVYDEGFLYFIATRGTQNFTSFYKVDAETGDVACTISLKQRNPDRNNLFSLPTVSNGFSYFLYQPVYQNMHTVLYCIDNSAQQVVFEVDVSEALETDFSQSFDPLRYWTRCSVLVFEESLYIGTMNGRICAFDSRTGQLQWTLPTDDSAG